MEKGTGATSYRGCVRSTAGREAPEGPPPERAEHRAALGVFCGNPPGVGGGGERAFSFPDPNSETTSPQPPRGGPDGWLLWGLHLTGTTLTSRRENDSFATCAPFQGKRLKRCFVPSLLTIY